MSSLSQFAGGGAPIPAGVLNGTAVLRSLLTDATTNGPLTTDTLGGRRDEYLLYMSLLYSNMVVVIARTRLVAFIS